MRSNRGYLAIATIAVLASLGWSLLAGRGSTWKTKKGFNLQVELKLSGDGHFESHEHLLAETKPFGDLYMSGTWSRNSKGIDLSIDKIWDIMQGRRMDNLPIPNKLMHLPLKGKRLYWKELAYLEKV